MNPALLTVIGFALASIALVSYNAGRSAEISPSPEWQATAMIPFILFVTGGALGFLFGVAAMIIRIWP